MKTDRLKNIEKNFKIKKKYLPPNNWFKMTAIYPPAIFIFFALFGLVYLLNHDMLLSYYAIPFVVIFLLATIWLKRTRQILLNNLLEGKDAYLACLAKPVREEGGWIYAVFTTDEKRHNKYFIEDLAKKISLDSFDVEVLEQTKKKVYRLPAVISPVSESAYMKAFRKKDITKWIATWRENEIFPVFYINEQNIMLIKPKDLEI